MNNVNCTSCHKSGAMRSAYCTLPFSPKGGGDCYRGRLRFANRPYLLILLQLVWTGWLFTFPVALDSDDALNFAHGVTRFSVLEFSPHFPGYPAFIWLARLINLAVDEPARAVQWASLLGSSLLAPLAALLAVRLWQRPSLLAPVWLLVLAELQWMALRRQRWAFSATLLFTGTRLFFGNTTTGLEINRLFGYTTCSLSLVRSTVLNRLISSIRPSR